MNKEINTNKKLKRPDYDNSTVWFIIGMCVGAAMGVIIL